MTHSGKGEPVNGWTETKHTLRRDTPAKEWRAATIHEAAHAVVAHFLGQKVLRVEVNDKNAGHAAVEWRSLAPMPDPVAFAMFCLAGHEAEHKAYGRPLRCLPMGDVKPLDRYGFSDASMSHLGKLSRKFVRHVWPEIRKVQRALLAKGRLSRRQFLAALRG